MDGRHVNFHLRRTTFNMFMVGSGVNVSDAMRLMRHKDIRLTSKVYTDLRLQNSRSAVNRIPRIAAGMDAEPMRAVGTLDASPKNIRSDILNVASASGRKRAKTQFSIPVMETDVNAINPTKQGVFCDSDNRRGGDSNPRYPFEHTGFRNQPHQPLGHLSNHNHWKLASENPT